MKHIKLFENWKDKLHTSISTKKSAKNWISKNSKKVIEINKKKNTFGESLTDEELDFLDKYRSMYLIVNPKKQKERWLRLPKGTIYYSPFM